jgi:hypothetical protein
MSGTKIFSVSASGFLLAAALAACDDGSAREIDVSAEQEASMCDVLAGSASTGPVPKQASADEAQAPNLSAQGIKQQVELTEFEGAYGGYLKLTIDPAAETPVFLLLDEAVPLEIVRADGSSAPFFEGAEESALCDEAGGRYSWFVSKSVNYLLFGPTDVTSLDLVLETVD